MTGDAFPVDELPLLCFSLRGFNVACTGYTDDRRTKLERMVRWCGGVATSYVNASTTVVVTEIAKGPKVDAARAFGIPIVRKDWIEHSYRAQDVAEFVPIKPLQGATIMLSGIAPNEYDKWAAELDKLGASFSKSMSTSVTHLIIDLSHTESGPRSKYYQAKLNHIAVVKRTWFAACRETKTWVSEKDYEVTVKDSPEPLPTAPLRIAPRSPNVSPPRSRMDLGVDIDPFADVPRDTEPPYLRGCNIYLHALAGAVGPLQDIIRSAQGSEASEASSSTHIVATLDGGAAFLTSALVSLLESGPNRPLLVAHTWLESCKDSRALLDTTPFLLQYDAATRLANLSISPPPRTASPVPNPKKRARDLALVKESNSDSEEVVVMMPMDLVEPVAKRPTPAPAAPTVPFPNLLAGLHFISAFPNDKKLSDIILSYGGTYWLLGKEPSPPVDAPVYMVLPHGYSFLPFRVIIENTRNRYPKSIIVSIQWLEHCIKEGQVDPVDMCQALFLPLQFPLERYRAAMSKFVICIAGIKGLEHDFITILGNLLGCKTSDAFLRKQTTHIISFMPSGKKQDLAIQNGRHLVKPEWLYCCALQGCAVAEESYSLVPRLPAPEPSAMSSQQQLQLASHLQPMPTAQPFHSYTGIPEMKTLLPANFASSSSTFLLPNQVLKGLVIYIGRLKSVDESREMKNLAVDLGAEIIWSFDTNVTHVVTDNKMDLPQAPPVSVVPVIRGKPNAPTHFASEPKSHKPFYVSPAWLRECAAQLIKVDEALFPATLNPLSALNIESGPDAYRPPTKYQASFFTSPHEFDSEYSAEPKKALQINHNAAAPNASQISKPNKSAANGSSSMPSKRSMTSVYVPKNIATAEFESFEDIDTHYNRPKRAALPAIQESQGRAQTQYPAAPPSQLPAFQVQTTTHAPVAVDANSFILSAPIAQPPPSSIQASIPTRSASTSHIERINEASHALPVIAPIKFVSDTQGLPSLQSQEEEALLQHLVPSSQITSLPPIVHAYSRALASSISSSKNDPQPEVAPPSEVLPEANANSMEVDIQPEVLESLPTSMAPTEPPSVDFDFAPPPISEPPSLEMGPPSLEIQPPSLELKESSPVFEDVAPHTTNAMEVDDAASLEAEEDIKPDEIPEKLAPSTYMDPPSPPKAEESDSVPMASRMISQQGSFPNANGSIFESQDVSMSQPPDPKAAELCFAQTEKMRELLALAQRSRQQNPRPARDSSAIGLADELTASILGMARAKAPSPLGSSTGANGSGSLPTGPRHIARSELLNLESHRAGVDRSDSSQSLSSGKSEVASSDTLPDFEDAGLLNSSPRGAEYLHEQEFDPDQAPKVSYGSLEPSDAVKEKMLDRAETHVNASQFQLDAMNEINRMAQWAKTSAGDSPSSLNMGITTEKENASSSSVASKRTLPGSESALLSSMAASAAHGARKNARTLSVTSVASEDFKQSPASDTTAVVSPKPLVPKESAPKPGIWAGKDGTKTSHSVPSKTPNSKLARPIDLDIDDEDCLAALDATPVKPKAKASSANWAGSKPSVTESTAAAPSRAPVATTSTAAPSNIFSKAKRAAHPGALAPSTSPDTTSRASKIQLYISTPVKSERESLFAKMLDKFGIQQATVPGSWTHFVIGPEVKTTDKYLISLANGCWVIKMDWLYAALKTGELPPEADFEFRPTDEQLKNNIIDPKLCRLLVAKQGKGVFEGMKIIHVGTEKDIWGRILLASRATADIRSADTLKLITSSEIRSTDFLHIEAPDWAGLSSKTQALLSHSHLVTMAFFAKFLQDAKCPDPTIFHPSFHRQLLPSKA